MEMSVSRLKLIESQICLGQTYYQKAKLNQPYVSDPIQFMELDSVIAPTLNAKRIQLRSLIENTVKPIIIEDYENESFPKAFVQLAASIDASLTETLANTNEARFAVAYEAGRVDLSFLLFYLSHAMAIESIHLFGSAHQKKLLPSLQSFRTIASWNYISERGKTDPEIASLVSVEGGYRLNGKVSWAINGDISDLLVISAKHTESGRILGLILDPKTAGITIRKIQHKHSIRATSTANILFLNVFVSEADLLPSVYETHIEVIKRQAKLVISAGVIGMMGGAYEIAAGYVRERIQFQAPLAAFQLTQYKLVRMMSLFQTSFLQAAHLAKQQFTSSQADRLKVHATTSGREFLSLARELFGGNGITHEFLVMKHLLDIEAAHSLYES